MAFATVERHARDRLEAQLAKSEMKQFFPEYELNYVATVLAAAKTFDVSELKDWDFPNVNTHDYLSRCRRFRSKAGLIAAQYQMEASSRNRR